MPWESLLMAAHGLGWTPDTFWRATWFEFTSALAENLRQAGKLPDEDGGAGAFRAMLDSMVTSQ